MIGCDASKLALNRKYFKNKKTMEQIRENDCSMEGDVLLRLDDSNAL